MRRLMLMVVVGGLILGGLTLASTASAQGTDTEPEFKQGIALALLKSQVVNVRVTTVHSRTFARGTANCRVETKKVAGEAAGTIDLWWVKQKVAWCWENVHGVQRIKSGPWFTPKCGGRDWGITDAGFHWEWKGWQACKPSGGVGYSYLKRWNQGWFRLCNPILGCIQNAKPYAWGDGAES